MKLVCIAILISIFQLQASVNAQDAKIDIQLKDANLDKVFSVIHQKTGYNFMFNHEDVSIFKVDAKFKNSSVKKILDKILKDLPLGYKFEDNVILVYHQKKTTKPKKTVVKGKVVDEKGNPLPGVSVVIKGTTVGISTDNKGFFKIELSEITDKTALVFSFIGMETKEIKVKGKKVINVKMIEDKKELDEVVITGYANINKKSFTGNAVSVSREELIKTSPKNIMKALQLFDPSLALIENNEMGSNPNALPEFYIRGRSGIGTTELDKISKTNLKGNPNSPTFILDGFEVGVERIFDLDINRIKSLTILKDAAATAMYGSRAANGVIVIETIAPKPGEIRVSYNMTANVSTPDLSVYNLFDARGKLDIEEIAGQYESKSEWALGGNLRKYFEKQNDILRGVNTDWLALPTRNTFNINHSLRIEGGHKDLLFGVDFKLGNNDGVMKGSSRRNDGITFNLIYRKNDLKFSNVTSYRVINSEESPYGNFDYYTKINPYLAYKDMDGNYPDELKYWTGEHTFSNPMVFSGYKSYDKRKSVEFTNSFSIEWYINNHFRFKSSINYQKETSNSKNFKDPDADKHLTHSSLLSRGQQDINTTNREKTELKAGFIFNKTINNHNINSCIGINAIQSKNDYMSFLLKGFPNGNMDDINFAAEIIDKPSGEIDIERLLGSYFTTNYSYKDTYLADVSVRTDGNSTFGTDKKYAIFWSGGLGLNLHEYNFIKGIPMINYFKVRGSYGEIGKTDFPMNAANTMYKFRTDKWYVSGIGCTLSALGNDKLRWERTLTYDFGVDLKLFHNRLSIKGSVYKKITKNLISKMSLPGHLGFTSYIGNSGELENKGYEIYITENLYRSKDLNINFFFNLCHNDNKITKISNELKAYNDKVTEYYQEHNNANEKFTKPLLKYVEGASVTSKYAMQSLGINPANGKEIYVNKNGELTYIWDYNENVVCGNSEPDARGTLGFNLSYKRFSLYTYFRYEYGAQIYNQTLVDKVEDADITYNADKRISTQRWVNPGDVTPLKDIKAWGQATMPTSRFIQDQNFIELSSVTLSYDFPINWIKKVKLLRIQFNADNLFRASTVKQERGTYYPFARTYNFTLNAKF
jgi:TonB-linked SusC/RagA family outer membrane protein